MSDLILPIDPEVELPFKACEMLVKVIGGDPAIGTADIYFEINNVLEEGSIPTPTPPDPADPDNPFVKAASGFFSIRGNATVEASVLREIAQDGSVPRHRVRQILKAAQLIPDA